MQDSPRTVASVLEHVFTHPNPETGSQPPEHIAWAIFSNGTVFFTAPTDELPLDASAEAIAAAARQALRELGPAVAGTPAADFNPVHLTAWFPGEQVFFITYDHPSVATVLVTGTDPLAAGLEARALRDADLAALEVAQVRGFLGDAWSRSGD